MIGVYDHIIKNYYKNDKVINNVCEYMKYL